MKNIRQLFCEYIGIKKLFRTYVNIFVEWHPTTYNSDKTKIKENKTNEWTIKLKQNVFKFTVPKRVVRYIYACIESVPRATHSHIFVEDISTPLAKKGEEKRD